MKGLVLIGIILLLYAALVFFITFKKPAAIWNMGKIKGFRKVLGEKETVIFFYSSALLAEAVGIWLIVN